jgi:hypothetical protein
MGVYNLSIFSEAIKNNPCNPSIPSKWQLYEIIKSDNNIRNQDIWEFGFRKNRVWKCPCNSINANINHWGDNQLSNSQVELDFSADNINNWMHYETFARRCNYRENIEKKRYSVSKPKSNRANSINKDIKKDLKGEMTNVQVEIISKRRDSPKKNLVNEPRLNKQHEGH